MKTIKVNVWLELAPLVLATATQRTIAATQNNVIQLENQKPGTTDWLLTKIKKGSMETIIGARRITDSVTT